jgi:hypothetical protein
MKLITLLMFIVSLAYTTYANNKFMIGKISKPKFKKLSSKPKTKSTLEKNASKDKKFLQEIKDIEVPRTNQLMMLGKKGFYN